MSCTLSEDEKEVLDYLRFKEGRTLRQIIAETQIFDVNIKVILKSLEDKGLAVMYYAPMSHPTRWCAL